MGLSYFESLPESNFKSTLKKVARLSPFFEQLLEQEPDLASQALAHIQLSLTEQQLKARYQAFVTECHDLTLPQVLRRLRQREMIRIVFRDLSRQADLLDTTGELSHLADFCVSSAVEHYYRLATEKYGTPVSPTGEPEQMIVLAMGKLGGYELNLSSDIDLIFLYTHQGQIELDNGKLLSHQEFFLRLSRHVIGALDDAGSINNVFRVDMRLRPYGDSGPLVLHRSAMEKYYIEQGRDWERYAFIKARVIAGDFAAGADFLEWMKPFIYRRHLDYGAVQSLREMKGLIARQVELKEMGNDLKLGPGGIREIEFIAQAQQLIWGGKYPVLQEPKLLTVLDSLVELDFLPEARVDSLKAAYVFLRNSEHTIQSEYDRQTHLLPIDESGQQRLANAMGFENYETYLIQLENHRSRVTDCFTELVTSPAGSSEDKVEEIWVTRWQDSGDEHLMSFKGEVARLSLQRHVLDSIDQLIPRLLRIVESSDDSALAITRMLPAIVSVLRRSTYLVFLIENPDALRRSVELVTLSPWIADQLESYPILFYELTDRSVKEVAVSRKELEGELREAMRAIEVGDLEIQMDTLRQFKLAATLKIAAMELLDELSIMEASDGLTALAEVVLDRSIEFAWSHLEIRHGIPGDESGQPLMERLAIVAYGKAGGLELAYGSDLDLVFLCPNHIKGNTDGRNQVNNNVFYVRLGQRIIHILTSFTRFGILYSADMRLKPQGNKGPLVATINAFERYQDNEAWTWEHQALIRARYVAGDSTLGQAFEEIRSRVIGTVREPTELLGNVLQMREKMRAHLASPANNTTEDGSEILGKFDLKHDSGAIVDIEFMVQYAVLA